MALQSMTGFARAEQTGAGQTAVWEIRSVNGRGFDLRLRLPSGLDRLEPALRTRAQSRFRRGTLNATLTLTRAAERTLLAVDEAALAGLAALRARLAETMPLAPSTLEGLLAIRGLLRSEAEDAPQEADDAEIVATFDAALDQLAAARETEARGIATVVAGQLDRIALLATDAAADPSLTVDAIAERLGNQIAVLQRASDLDPGRLHAEAALLATRADIREEVDRLAIHVETARNLMASGDAVGRKLDFLAQEFNREANTLCSKANAASLTAIGLDLKVVIDQFREQIQNLE